MDCRSSTFGQERSFHCIKRSYWEPADATLRISTELLRPRVSAHDRSQSSDNFGHADQAAHLSSKRWRRHGGNIYACRKELITVLRILKRGMGVWAHLLCYVENPQPLERPADDLPVLPEESLLGDIAVSAVGLV